MRRPEEALHRAGIDALMGPLDRKTGARRRAVGMLPQPWLAFHVPNGGGRSKAEAGILKAMGVLAGMPDLFVMGPSWVHPADRDLGQKTVCVPLLVAIEFKAPPKPLKRGGVSKAAPRLSPAQRARQADLEACGVPLIVVTDINEMTRQLRELGVPLRDGRHARS